MSIFDFMSKKNANTLTQSTNTTNEASVIRLFYVALEKFKRYGTNNKVIGKTYTISSLFKLPKEMSLEDACKVLSFLSEKVEKENNLEPACSKSVEMVSNVLENFGFKKIETKTKGHFHGVAQYKPFSKIKTFTECKEVDGVVDLFTVGGDFNIFKNSDLYDRYFNWYTEGVNQKEIENIYKKIGKQELFNQALKKKNNQDELVK